MNKLSPSLLSADFTHLAEAVEVMEKNNVPYLHVDVMDGVFVPNISILSTFTTRLVASVRIHLLKSDSLENLQLLLLSLRLIGKKLLTYFHM